MSEDTLTQDLIKEIFDYDPEIGILYNRISRSSRAVKNLPSGSMNSKGYLQVSINCKLYYVHRIIWLYVYGEFPPDQIDHINQVCTDNKILNLRAVTKRENHLNQSMYKNNTSGFTGVSWSKHFSKWHAHIQVKRKHKNLGYFINKEDAIKAREKANIKYHFHPNHGSK